MTEKKYLPGTAFRQWVEQMYDECSANPYSKYSLIGNTTYVYLRSKVGKAKCHPNDKQDAYTGIAYAWARCTGQEEYYNKEDAYKFMLGNFVDVTLISGTKGRYLKFIAEGVDNYCFKLRSGHLEVYDKNRIKNITLSV